MTIELQETKVKEMEDKKLFIGTYWLKHNKVLYPTKFNALLSEAYEPGNIILISKHQHTETSTINYA